MLGKRLLVCSIILTSLYPSTALSQQCFLHVEENAQYVIEPFSGLTARVPMHWRPVSYDDLRDKGKTIGSIFSSNSFYSSRGGLLLAAMGDKDLNWHLAILAFPRGDKCPDAKQFIHEMNAGLRAEYQKSPDRVSTIHSRPALSYDHPHDKPWQAIDMDPASTMWNCYLALDDATLVFSAVNYEDHILAVVGVFPGGPYLVDFLPSYSQREFCENRERQFDFANRLEDLANLRAGIAKNYTVFELWDYPDWGLSFQMNHSASRPAKPSGTPILRKSTFWDTWAGYVVGILVTGAIGWFLVRAAARKHSS